MSYAYQSEPNERDNRVDMRNIERNITISESEKKALEHKKEEVALQRRRLGSDLKKLQISISENEEELKKIEKELYMFEEELKRLEKKRSELRSR